MFVRLLTAILAAIAIVAPLGVRASVISGPPLFAGDVGWTVSGLSFQAVANVNLVGFVFQNQGQADTVVLTDSAGNILHSLATPAAMTSYTANVNWGLTAGQTYWLLQDVAAGNSLVESWNDVLPSNSDIAITFSGVFAMTIASAITGNQFGPNDFWVAFNDITTVRQADAVPEPGSLAFLGLGLVGAGLARRSRSS